MHQKQSFVSIKGIYIYIPSFPIKLTKFSTFPGFFTVEKKYCSHNKIRAAANTWAHYG